MNREEYVADFQNCRLCGNTGLRTVRADIGNLTLPCQCSAGIRYIKEKIRESDMEASAAESEMIERAARAAWEKRREMAKRNMNIDVEPFGDGTIPRANGIFDEVIAIFEAIREPTEAMKEAGDNAVGEIGYGDDPQSFVWPIMIDAAMG